MYLQPILEGEAESIVVGVVWVVVVKLSVSIQFISLLEVDVVNSSTLVVGRPSSQLNKALLSQKACDEVVWLFLQADVEITRDHSIPPRTQKILKIVPHLSLTPFSRAINMDAIKVYRRELGHLDVGCLDVANMLKG